VTPDGVETAIAARTPKARGLATRKRVLQAAQDLFARHGFEGTSIGEIASRAGVGVGTVYHHFADKRAILIRLLEQQEGERLVGASGGPLALALRESDVRSAVERVVWFFGKLRREHPSIYAVSLDLTRRDEAIAAHCRRIERIQRKALERDLEAEQREGRVRPDLDPAASAVWLHVLLQGAMSMLSEADDPEELAPMVRELSAILCRHLLPR
jgi:AcrR family transcriptional regulator